MLTKPMILLLLGPSGVGKSSIKCYLESKLEFESAPKFTTRAPRGTVEDERDFIFCDVAEVPVSGVLRFESYGATFAIQVTMIDDSLRRGRDHVLIVGDPVTVRTLQNLYPGRVYTALIYCDVDVLRQRVCGVGSTARSSRWPVIQREIESIYEWLSCVQSVIDNSGPFASTALQIEHLIAMLHGLKDDE